MTGVGTGEAMLGTEMTTTMEEGIMTQETGIIMITTVMATIAEGMKRTPITTAILEISQTGDREIMATDLTGDKIMTLIKITMTIVPTGGEIATVPSKTMVPLMITIPAEEM